MRRSILIYFQLASLCVTARLREWEACDASGLFHGKANDPFLFLHPLPHIVQTLNIPYGFISQSDHECFVTFKLSFLHCQKVQTIMTHV